MMPGLMVKCINITMLKIDWNYERTHENIEFMMLERKLYYILGIYTYQGGRLVRADDAGEDCTLSVATDWSEAAQENGEYTWDPDGRMTSDKNKGVTQITYNALGLVETVHTPQGLIRHTYDSEGRLVRRSYGTLEWVTVDMGFTSFTRQEYRESRRVDYLGELMLEDGKVYRRLHEAGWTDGEGREVAAVRDWRGSLRATWTDTGEGGEKVFDNLTGYYPYGLPWADWQGSERWLYGGKELEREHGLWTYDFHAREQDPALGRFRAPDPLADRYKHLNPYLYAAANPITYTDPTGCEVNNIIEGENRKIFDTIVKESKSNPIFANYYSFIENHEETITFAEGGKINKDGTINPAYYDPDTKTVYFCLNPINITSIYEDSYHPYQDLKGTLRDNRNNSEYEAKLIAGKVAFDMSSNDVFIENEWSGGCPYTIPFMERFEKDPSIFTKDNISSPSFLLEYIKGGQEFINIYKERFDRDGVEILYGYDWPVTGVPQPMLDLLK